VNALRGELLGIAASPISAAEVYSGVARSAGVLWASRHKANSRSKRRTAVVITHPSSNFLGHFALPVLAERGVDAIGMTTRYIGGDSTLLVENCVLDVGAVIRFLREDGYGKIVLAGFSGGGGLAALYQSQAENPTITGTPAGGPPDLTQAELSSVDAIVLWMAHPGRALVYTDWLDPAIRREADPFDRDPALDMFLERNGPPFSEEFVLRFRAAQRARNMRIADWVRATLAELAERARPVADLPFVVHGTTADPRMLDLSLDPSDRQVGTPWGPAADANYSPSTLGHLTSLRSWLSQWSLADSQANAYLQLPKVSVPVHVIYGSADSICYPSYARQMYDAVAGERRLTAIRGARHYYDGRPDLVEEAVTSIVQWLDEMDLM
jgi:pimeloyl-ACP methyl ester carboxylesterase